MATSDSQDTPTTLPPSQDLLDKFKSIATIASLAIVPVVVSFVGGYYRGLTKDREVQAKFVGLAVSILKDPPEKQSRGLREWVTQILGEYSCVKMSDTAKKELVESCQLPGSSAAVRDVKAMLTKLGYFNGPIDGQVGPMLRKAVASFNAQIRLRQMETLARWLWTKLLRSTHKTHRQLCHPLLGLSQMRPNRAIKPTHNGWSLQPPISFSAFRAQSPLAAQLRRYISRGNHLG